MELILSPSLLPLTSLSSLRAEAHAVQSKAPRAKVMPNALDWEKVRAASLHLDRCFAASFLYSLLRRAHPASLLFSFHAKVDIKDDAVFAFGHGGFCALEEVTGVDVVTDADGTLRLAVRASGPLLPLCSVRLQAKHMSQSFPRPPL